MEGVILERREPPRSHLSLPIKRFWTKDSNQKRFQQRINLLFDTKNKVIESKRKKTREMHITNIPQSDQWGTEISILFGVVGVILLGKLPLYKFSNIFQAFEIRVQHFYMLIHLMYTGCCTHICVNI